LKKKVKIKKTDRKSMMDEKFTQTKFFPMAINQDIRDVLKTLHEDAKK